MNRMLFIQMNILISKIQRWLCHQVIIFVGTLYQGYPLLLQQGRTRVIIRNYAIRGGAAGPHGSGSYLTGPTAPDLLPSLGWVR